MSLLALFAACGQAAAIECPKEGKDAYVLSSSQKRLLTKGTYIDLVNEIDEMSASLKTQKPDISYSALVDAIVAAYCPVIANEPSLSEQQKRDDVQKFSAMVVSSSAGTSRRRPPPFSLASSFRRQCTSPCARKRMLPVKPHRNTWPRCCLKPQARATTARRTFLGQPTNVQCPSCQK